MKQIVSSKMKRYEVDLYISQNDQNFVWYLFHDRPEDCSYFVLAMLLILLEPAKDRRFIGYTVQLINRSNFEASFPCNEIHADNPSANRHAPLTFHDR